MSYLQQGDVLIKRIKDLPDEKLTKVKTNVLREGEHTGHSHRIVSGQYEIYKTARNLMILKAISMCMLKHQEHNEVNIPPGEYLIDNVKEYDHFSEEARRVLD